MKKYYILLIVATLYGSNLNAQIGIGTITGFDFYQYYDKGDINNELESSTSGSAMLNIILGPKVWIGGPKFSLSLEAPINWGIFHFDINEFKGLGAIAFPLGAKLNFGAASGFANVNVVGFSMGGGLQYMNTEIYTTKKDFKDKIETGFFRTYYGEVAFHVGLAGFDVALYTRYGRGEADQRNLNVGISVNTNLTQLAKMAKNKVEGGSQEKLEEMTYNY